jgi:hypothetical protein
MLINSKKYVKRRIILALVQYLDTNTNRNYLHRHKEVLYQHPFHARNEFAHITGIIALHFNYCGWLLLLD